MNYRGPDEVINGYCTYSNTLYAMFIPKVQYYNRRWKTKETVVHQLLLSYYSVHNTLRLSTA